MIHNTLSTIQDEFSTGNICCPTSLQKMIAVEIPLDKCYNASEKVLNFLSHWSLCSPMFVFQELIIPFYTPYFYISD